jgi:REP element-mobilizing transposase RayT
MSKYIDKSHNVSVLLYHLVCPAKYRRAVFTEQVDEELRAVCLEISKRYEIVFIEIGVDKDHAHFLIQSVPIYSPSQIAQIVKSITAREIFIRVPEVKKHLWGGAFWTSGYFINTVGQQGNEETIRDYLKGQGRENEYKRLHRAQLSLF